MPVWLVLIPLFLLGGWWYSQFQSPSQAQNQIVELQQSHQKPIRFVAMGDFGTGASIQYAVAEAIRKKCQLSGCDFALSLGDNIYNNGVTAVNDPQFASKFEQPFAKLPFRFYMTLGNHDYRGNVQAQVDYTQHSKKWYMPSRYYVFEQGPATFFALDTNLPDKAQRDYMQAQLARAKTPWKLVFGHHPRYTYSYYKDSQSADLKALVDTFCGKSQLYLAGHEHDKQYLKSVCGTEYLIAGTGGGNRPKLGKGPLTIYASQSYGFAWVEVSEKELHLQLLDSKGKVEFERRLKVTS